MKLLALCLYACIALRDCYSNEIECLPANPTWEQKLDYHRFTCGYHKWTPPHTNESEPVLVGFVFNMEYFNYMSSEQELFVYARTALIWDDERLKWDPSKFNGIEDTFMHSTSIWTPSIVLLNSNNDNENVQQVDGLCQIGSSGSVQCTTEMTFYIPCVADLREWPRDQQTCHLEIGAWYIAEKKTNIRLLFLPEQDISLTDAEFGAEWDIIYIEREETPSMDTQLKLSYTLERHAATLVALVIYPSVVLSALTLSTLLLDARCHLRLSLSCFSLMCNLYFLSNLASQIPEHSNNPPNILLYFRGSVIMNVLNVALAILMKALCNRDTPVPLWIVLTNEYVFTSFGKFVIFPRWRIENINGEKREKVKGWTDFATLFNIVWIYLSVIVYIILYYVYVPCKSPYKPKYRALMVLNEQLTVIK